MMDTEPPARDIALQEFCRFLAACYYEPGPEFLEEAVFESMAKAARILGPGFESDVRRLGQAFEAAGHERLLVDYARLFLGPSEMLARPYESSWSGTDGGRPDFAFAIEELYTEGGFEIAKDFHELPDHIAAELEFLYLLRAQENHARLARDLTAVDKASGLRHRLLSEHLARWVPPLTEAIKAGAESAYYRALADLTARYLDLECEPRSGIHGPLASPPPR